MLRTGDDWGGQHFAFRAAGTASDAGKTGVAIEHGPHGPTATISDAHLLFNAEFTRAGSDLILHGDGKTAVVHDYFASDKHATLMSPAGATLSPAVVDALAGSQAPGQYAQNGMPQGVAQAIGRVAVVHGNAVIIRNGVAITLHAGDAVLKGDVLQTNSGTLGVTFNDGSTINLTANSRVVVNEFVYDAHGAHNSEILNLVQGSLSFISGEVAHSGGNMKIGTPVATMGIRGTVGGVTDSTDGTVQFYVVQSDHGAVIEDNNGNVIAQVVQDGPLIEVRPNGPLQVVAEEIGKTPAELAAELSALQAIVSTQQVGQQIIQQFLQNPNPQSTEHHTQIEIDIPQTTINNIANNTYTGNDNTTVTVTTTDTTNNNTTTTDYTVQIPPPPAPTVLAADTSGPHTITERNGLTGSTLTDSVSGALSFTDGNLTETHTVSQGAPTFLWSGGTLTAAQISTLTADGTLTLTETDSNGSGTGAIGFTYSAADNSFDFLAAGEKLTLTYNVTVTDEQNVSSTQPVTITVTGTNDAPVIAPMPIISEVPIPNPLPAGTDAAAQYEVAPAMSQDGRWVAFFSSEVNPDANDGNNDKSPGDVFLYDRQTGVTTVLTDAAHIGSLSLPADEAFGNGLVSISADGNTVVFRGEHQVLDPQQGESDQTNQIFIYDRASDTVHLLTNPDNNNAPYDIQDSASINAAGNLIAFASDVDTSTDSPTRDLYVTDLSGHIQTTITLAQLGITEPSDTSNSQIQFEQPDISGDGSYLTFWTYESTHDPETGNDTPTGLATLYTYDLVTNQYQIIATTTASDNDWPASMSNDGRYVVFQSDQSTVDGHTDIFVWDRDTGLSIDITAQANGNSERATISGNGNVVIFASDATNLVPGDSNGQGDTFVYNLTTHDIQLLSVATDGTQGDGDSTLGSSLAYGGYGTTFGSTAGNLVVPNDTDNGLSDIFIVDRSAGTLGAVTQGDTTPAYTGAPANSLSTHGAFTFTDVDLTDTHTVQVLGETTISAPDGFTVPSGGLGTFTATVVETPGSGVGQVAWTFTVDNASTVALGAFQNVQEEYTVQLSDGHGGVATQTVGITIFGVNDAPVISASGQENGQTVNENSTLVFNNDSGNKITVSDSDTNNLIVTLIAAAGTLTLSETSGLAFTQGDGHHDATMTFSGTQADINAALDGLTLKSAEAGNTTLTIQADDGHGAPTTDVVNVTVTPEVPHLFIADNSLDVAENGTINLGIAAFGNDLDDHVSVTISGFKSGDTLTDLAHNTLTINNGSITLTPLQLIGLDLHVGSEHNDSLTVTATNTENGVSASTSQDISVAVDHHPPVAVDDNVITNVGINTPFQIPDWALLQNDTGGNNQNPLSLTDVGFGSSGTVSHDDGAVTFDDLGFVFRGVTYGSGGSFFYQVSDGSVTDTGQVTVSQDDSGALKGTSGNDILIGNSSGSTIDGKGGNDILIGGSGNDTLTGGGGHDTFVFIPSDNGSGLQTIGHDTITDFDVVHDTLVFDQSLFTSVADVLDSITQDNQGDTVIHTDNGQGKVTLDGVSNTVFQGIDHGHIVIV